MHTSCLHLIHGIHHDAPAFGPLKQESCFVVPNSEKEVYMGGKCYLTGIACLASTDTCAGEMHWHSPVSARRGIETVFPWCQGQLKKEKPLPLPSSHSFYSKAKDAVLLPLYYWLRVAIHF